MSSNVLSQIFNSEFENKNVTTIMYKEKPVWILGEIEEVLGYARKTVSNKLAGDWQVDFDEVLDYVRLSGAELDQLRGLFAVASEATTNPISSKTRSLLLLTESGLNMVLLKTQKPVGVKLRKFLSKEVLPQIARTGQYASNQPFTQLQQIEMMLSIEKDRLRLEGLNKLQQQKLIEAQPKVEFYDDVTGSSDTIAMSLAAKVLNFELPSGKILGRNRLFEILREHSILRHNNEPYQAYIDRGWFRVIEQKWNTPEGETKISLKTLVYQKGVAAIRELLVDVCDVAI